MIKQFPISIVINRNHVQIVFASKFHQKLLDKTLPSIIVSKYRLILFSAYSLLAWIYMPCKHVFRWVRWRFEKQNKRKVKRHNARSCHVTGLLNGIILVTDKWRYYAKSTGTMKRKDTKDSVNISFSKEAK